MEVSLIILLTGLSVGLIAYSVLGTVFSEDRQVARRLKQLSVYERQQATDVEPLAAPFFDRVVRPAFNGAVSTINRLAPAGSRKRTTEKLRIAALLMDADSFLVLKILSFLGVGLMGWYISKSYFESIASVLLASMIIGLLGFHLPNVWLNSKVEKRQSLIRRQLPDMLDMLLISVEAGLGFDAAVSKYIRNTEGPLSREFAEALSEIQAGMSRREALRNLADRTEVPELNTFVMAMIQADVFGISVSSVLRAQSKEMRLKKRQYAEEVAQKAPAKMVFPLIGCILPATLIVLMGPAVIAIGRAFGAIP